MGADCTNLMYIKGKENIKKFMEYYNVVADDETDGLDEVKRVYTELTKDEDRYYYPRTLVYRQEQLDKVFNNGEELVLYVDTHRSGLEWLVDGFCNTYNATGMRAYYNDESSDDVSFTYHLTDGEVTEVFMEEWLEGLFNLEMDRLGVCEEARKYIIELLKENFYTLEISDTN